MATFEQQLAAAAVRKKPGQPCFLCALPEEQRKAVDSLIRKGRSDQAIAYGLQGLNVRLGPDGDVTPQRCHVLNHRTKGHHEQEGR